MENSRLDIRKSNVISFRIEAFAVIQNYSEQVKKHKTFRLETFSASVTSLALKRVDSWYTKRMNESVDRLLLGLEGKWRKEQASWISTFEYDLNPLRETAFSVVSRMIHSTVIGQQTSGRKKYEMIRFFPQCHNHSLFTKISTLFFIETRRK
jgi:hypothetical protein